MINNSNIIKLSTIWNISNKINSTIDLNTLLFVIMESAKTILNCEGSALMLMDHETNELKFDIVTGEVSSNETNVNSMKSIRVPLGVGIAGIVAQTEEPLIVNDAENDPRVYKKVDEGTKFSTKNLICVPMKMKDKLIGVLEGVNAKGRDGFTNHDLIILNYLSDQAAIAIQNRQLFESLKVANAELGNRVKEFTALYEIALASNQSYDLREFADSAINIIAESIGVERASLFLFNKENDKLIHYASIGIEELKDSTYSVDKSAGIMGTVFKGSYPILVIDIEKEDIFLKYKKNNYKTNSFLSIPLVINEITIGILNLSDKKNGECFNATDLLICTSIGSNIANAYNTFKLNQEILKQERVKKDLETAAAIQKKILPKSFTNPANIEIEAISLPARDIGGDFYDFLKIDENSFAVLIADVSGKGISAALFAALTRNTLRGLTENFTKPSNLFERGNKSVCRDSEAGMFVTAAIFTVNFSQKTINYVSAGHNEQIFLKADSDEINLIKGKGIPLGVFNNSTYEELTLDYNNGDILILFTDGVVEANNDDHEEYGEERFYNLIKKYRHLDSKNMLESIKAEIMEFSSKDNLFDDLTLMIVKF